MSAHHHHGLYILLYTKESENSFFWLQASKDKYYVCYSFRSQHIFLCFTWMNSNMLQISFTYRHHHNGIQIELLIANIHKFGGSELLWTPTKLELWASKEVRPPSLQTIIPSIFLQQASCFFNYSPNHVNRGNKLSWVFGNTIIFFINKYFMSLAYIHSGSNTILCTMNWKFVI